ncbi:unnamed protein product (macronuclear) [Paramecium tetraurelia]|uniref:Transmembrane protein n=1 Tax=Paramecium tetraurelia TaxID=5888 RepID=A0DRE2_PARTE|nr:uncharacterized protein GSPATT00019326001 [Paramecium tetraurelia]CAK85609.1 unnamed protein product [Paramecium tetraurelia]|eukprot:XP_001453006.1 hypothetical protein (macronuclear) [Paramecium tetraurelia strain d4-2]
MLKVVGMFQIKIQQGKKTVFYGYCVFVSCSAQYIYKHYGKFEFKLISMIPGVQVCSMNGIEAPVPFQQSIIAYYFFTLLFLYTIYYALENVKHSIVVFVRWPLLLYSLAAIIIGVVSIIQSYSLTTSDIQEGWNKMTQWRNSSNNLLDENKRNLILISIYHFIYGFVFIILFGLLFNYQTIMPQNWRPPFSSRPLMKSALIYREGMVDQVQQPKQDDEENQEKQQDKPFQNQNQSEIRQPQQPVDQQPSTIFQKKNTGRRVFGKQVQNSQVQQQSQQQSQLQQSQIPPQPNSKQDQPDDEANQQPF